jgi:hypothetical protein
LNDYAEGVLETTALVLHAIRNGKTIHQVQCELEAIQSEALSKLGHGFLARFRTRVF